MVVDDYIGLRFGRLEVKEFIGVRINKSTTGKTLRYYDFKCKCDCGNECTAQYTTLKHGHKLSCGCLHKELAKELGKRNSIGHGKANFNNLFYTYKKQAKRRNLEFSLTEDEFRGITSSNCHYCGKEPTQTNYNNKSCDGVYLSNGIDRVDNSEGYILSNVVLCCKRCNLAKHTMGCQEFKDWIRDVYLHINNMDT